ncbi:hypothetical protein H6F87_21415 [Cyanobacteria bacterium FACHB-502]|nr:hypothetical protein [Cyanobacteria bacterium FACHB-502]MBD2023162.1 hypothetical protein [Leptolyngbya sp. FACHB-711]
MSAPVQYPAFAYPISAFYSCLFPDKSIDTVLIMHWQYADDRRPLFSECLNEK